MDLYAIEGVIHGKRQNAQLLAVGMNGFTPFFVRP